MEIADSSPGHPRRIVAIAQVYPKKRCFGRQRLVQMGPIARQGGWIVFADLPSLPHSHPPVMMAYLFTVYLTVRPHWKRHA
jgi:hypothetical protein